MGACALLAALPAAAAIPPPVEAMIREAARGGDAGTLNAVVRVAKATNPGETAAIDALGGSLLAEAQAKARREREERLASMDLFEGWVGEGQLGAGLTTGNTEEASAVIGVSLRRDGLRTRHKFAALVDYLHTNGRTTRQKFAVDYALNYTLDDGLYAVGTLGWERDIFAGYARRFTESLGLGYRAISRRRMTLDLEGGPALRQTLYTSGRSEDEFGARGSLAWRWTLLSGTILSEDASVVHAADNTTFSSRTALTTKLTGRLSARMSFNVQHETEPLFGRERTDTATRATLVYGF